MSAMTDIRDRLKASGDEEAATALDVAMRAAGDRLEQLEEARVRIAAGEEAREALIGRTAALQEELAAKDATLTAITKAVREYLPPDGISAKECLSRILEVLDRLKAEDATEAATAPQTQGATIGPKD